MMNKKKYLSVLSVAAITGLLSIATANTVLAANGDLYKLDTKEMVLSNEKTFKEKFKFGLSIAESTQEYGYEYNGKIYNFKEANEAASKVEEKTKENVLKAMEEIKEVGLAEDFNQGLVVNSVSAITGQKIKKAAEQQIGFLVNGKEADLDALEEAGYTVTFKYNKTGRDYNVNGIVDGTKVAEKFEYQVEVTKDEEKFTTDWTEVTVVDASKAVKVNKVALVDVSDNVTEWKQAVLTNKVTFVAAEYENSLGEKNTDEEKPFEGVAPEVESAKSSDITTAYYDTATKEIVVLKDGKVTFDVKFADIKETVKVEVTVKAEQKAVGIKTEASKVEAGKESTVKFTVVDKDGEVYLKDGAKVQVTTKAGTEEESAVKEIALVKGEASFKHTFVKGETVVTVYADAEKKEKLGSFTINAVDTEGNPDKYTLALAEKQKAELDLNAEANQTEVKLDAKAFVDGVEVNLPDAADFKVVAKSSNENIEAKLEDKVVTVKVKDGKKDEVKAGDKADIQLVIVEGDKETKVGDIVTVEVKNSTFQVTSMTLKADTKVKVVKGAKEDALKDAVVLAIKEGEGEEGKKVTSGMIKSVTYVSSNEAVIVEVEAINGGKTFTLDAKYVEDATLTEAKLVDKTNDQGEDRAAEASNAQIKVVANDVGTEANGIEFSFTQEEPTSGKVEVTLTPAQDATKAKVAVKYKSEATVSEVVQELNSKISTLNLTASAVGTESGAYNTAGTIKLVNGSELVKGTPAILTLTFSENVEVDGDFSIVVTGKNATIADKGVKVENKTVTITLADAATIAENDTITEVKGLKTAKGEVVVPEAGFKVTK